MKVMEVTCRSKSSVQLFATIGNSEQILYNLTDHDRNKVLIEIKCLVLSCCFISIISYSYIYIFLLLFPFIHFWFVMYPSVCLEITGKLNYSCPPLVGIWCLTVIGYWLFNFWLTIILWSRFPKFNQLTCHGLHGMSINEFVLTYTSIYFYLFIPQFIQLSWNYELT